MENHKGDWCPYRPSVFCQEGYCSGCHVYDEEQARATRGLDYEVDRDQVESRVLAALPPDTKSPIASLVEAEERAAAVAEAQRIVLFASWR